MKEETKCPVCKSEKIEDIEPRVSTGVGDLDGVACVTSYKHSKCLKCGVLFDKRIQEKQKEKQE